VSSRGRTRGLLKVEICEWLIFESLNVTVDEQSARLEKRRIRYAISYLGVCLST